ncbi:beta-galactosidase BoGH2A [Abditibacteriota bacterium]|nr:beta-galactosidase BoGH2A [Abditibacteriota bacterium]
MAKSNWWSALILALFSGLAVSCSAQTTNPTPQKSAPAKSVPPSHIIFPRAFAPSQGLTAPVEQHMRSELCLNGSWQFQPIIVPSTYQRDQGSPPHLTAPVANKWDKTPIKVPSPWNVNAFTRGDGEGGDFRTYPIYPAPWEKVEMGWLRRSVRIASQWKGQRLLLHFEAVAGEAVVLFNGHEVARNFDLFMPFECDVTPWAKLGGENELLVGVRKASLFNDKRTTGSRPYPGGSFWGQSVVGIWQDVFLLARPPLRASDTYVQPQVAQNILTAQVTLRNDSEQAQTVQVNAQVQPWMNDAKPGVLDAPEPRWHLGNRVLSLPAQTLTVAPHQSATVSLQQQVNGQLQLWLPDAPHLYGLVVSVASASKTIDRQMTRFGWRQFTFEGNRQLLNGKPLELRGDSWHFMGIPQMTRRYAWAWFTALKNANGNAVRLHAQPYPRFYLDMADEMGVCVLDETANWGSDGAHKYDSDDFWMRADDQVQRLVLRDRNHASVFGWSVSNEVAWFINRSKNPEQFERLKSAWRSWDAIVRQLDPSRPWISTDGDFDAEGTMPTNIGHYSSLDGPSKGDKPYGIGETTGAYSDTPKQVSNLNGGRAYESMQGRMEGIAIEAYEKIAEQRKLHADYASVFNLVWYGLKPLEIGFPETTHPSTLKDGIFFGPYREGVPGVQPERLGPYSTTLNPGYDPRLPLYKPWPLFDAIKAAFAAGGPASSPWAHRSTAPRNASTPLPAGARLTVLGAPASRLSAQLNALGATVDDGKELDNANIIVIDGANPPSDTALLQQVEERVKSGATCLVWGLSPDGLPPVNMLLPQKVELNQRGASSLIVRGTSPLLAGLGNNDFYFTEILPGDVITHALEGPFVKNGRVLLEAPSTDWRKWNFQGETIKTAATLRSEREAKPDGTAMAELSDGQGRYVVTTLTADSFAPDLLSVFKRLLTGGGIAFVERNIESDAAFDAFGTLKQALVAGSFGSTTAEQAYETDDIGIKTGFSPVEGSRSGEREWIKRQSDQSSIFDFNALGLPGPHDNAVAYLSFWIWSPRALDNLLLEPNMPKLDLLVGSDDGCQVYLNGKMILEDRGTHPLTPGSLKSEAMPLQRGWNHFLVKAVQGSGQWQFRADLRCSAPLFLTKLHTSIVGPTSTVPNP